MCCSSTRAEREGPLPVPDPILFLSFQFQSTAIKPGRSPIGRVIPYRCVSVAHYKMFVSPDRARASDPRIDRGPLPTHRAFLSATSNDSFFRMWTSNGFPRRTKRAAPMVFRGSSELRIRPISMKKYHRSSMSIKYHITSANLLIWQNYV